MPPPPGSVRVLTAGSSAFQAEDLLPGGVGQSSAGVPAGGRPLPGQHGAAGQRTGACARARS